MTMNILDNILSRRNLEMFKMVLQFNLLIRNLLIMMMMIIIIMIIIIIIIIIIPFNYYLCTFKIKLRIAILVK